MGKSRGNLMSYKACRNAQMKDIRKEMKSKSDSYCKMISQDTAAGRKKEMKDEFKLLSQTTGEMLEGGIVEKFFKVLKGLSCTTINARDVIKSEVFCESAKDEMAVNSGATQVKSSLKSSEGEISSKRSTRYKDSVEAYKAVRECRGGKFSQYINSFYSQFEAFFSEVFPVEIEDSSKNARMYFINLIKILMMFRIHDVKLEYKKDIIKSNVACFNEAMELLMDGQKLILSCELKDRMVKCIEEDIMLQFDEGVTKTLDKYIDYVAEETLILNHGLRVLACEDFNDSQAICPDMSEYELMSVFREVYNTVFEKFSAAIIKEASPRKNSTGSHETAINLSGNAGTAETKELLSEKEKCESELAIIKELLEDERRKNNSYRMAFLNLKVSDSGLTTDCIPDGLDPCKNKK